MASVEKYSKGLQPAYRLYWTVNGTRRTRVVRMNKTEAKKLAYEYERTQFQKRPRQVLYDLLAKYDAHLKGIGRSPKTIKRYDVGIKSFIDFVGKDTDPNEITNRDLEEYKIERNKEVKKTSVNIDLRSIRAFLSWLFQYHYIDSNPFKGVKMFKTESSVNYLSPYKLKKLGEWIYAHEGKTEADLICMYLITGCRAIELLPPQFTWKNVLDDRLLIKGKYNKERFILLNDSIKKILARRKERSILLTIPTTKCMIS